MNVDRLSITMDPKLGAAARKAAKQAGVSLSAWVAAATAARVRNEALGRLLDDWEAEDGAPTPEQLARAATTLGMAQPRRNKNRRPR